MRIAYTGVFAIGGLILSAWGCGAEGVMSFLGGVLVFGTIVAPLTEEED